MEPGEGLSSKPSQINKRWKGKTDIEYPYHTPLVIHGLSSALNLGAAFCLNNDIAPQYPVEINGRWKNHAKICNYLIPLYQRDASTQIIMEQLKDIDPDFIIAWKNGQSKDKKEGWPRKLVKVATPCT